MSLRTLLSATLIILIPSAPVTAQSRTNPAVAAVEPHLVGTWRLVRYEDTAKDGTVTHRYGDHPKGYFVYDPTGHLHIQIMRDPAPAHFSSGDAPTDAETHELYRSYVAYFGTYRVDKARHILTHVVEGALNPFYTGTDQLRPYKLTREVLIIESTDPKDGTYHYRELHRVH